MPVITGFDQLASVPEEQITNKSGRRVISGKQGTMAHEGGRTRCHSPTSAGAICLGD
jgi:hypothetical protein